jgi:hypothetical protein
MAIIKDPKDPQGLMRALGPAAMGMKSSEENLIGDEPTFNTRPSVNKKLDYVIKLVQDISKKSGLQKDEVYKILSKINMSAENYLKKTITSALDVINPQIKKDLIEITRLLDTGSLTDQEKAFRKLEELQRKFNFDLSKFNKDLGKNLNKLNNALEKMAQDREERITKAKEIQAEELSKGRASTIDEEKGVIKYLSRDEIREKEVRKNILEKRIETLQERFNKALKEKGTGEKGAFSDEQQERLQKIDSSIKFRRDQLGTIKSEIGDKEIGSGNFLSIIGSILKGEKGPTLIKGFFGLFYSGFKSIFDTLDTLLLDIPSTLGKKILSIGLPPLTKAMEKAGNFFSNAFSAFTKKTLKVLGDLFKPLTDSLKKGLKNIGGSIAGMLGIGSTGGATEGVSNLLGKGRGTVGGRATGGVSNLLGMGRGTVGGGAIRAVGVGSRALPLAGLLAGGGGAAAAGAGAATAASGVAAAGGAAAAGGGLMAGLGGLAAAAAPFLLPALGIAAAVGGIGYLGKKLYDKSKENKNKTPEELQAMSEESAATEFTGGVDMGDVSKETKKILGKSDTALKKIQDLDTFKSEELKSESERFSSEVSKEPKNLAILNQNSPTTINRGESKTIVPASYINTEPTYNIINTNKIF